MGSRLPEIIYEDNHLIAVNKRAGDLVQGDKTGDVPLPELLKSYIKNKFNKPGAVFLGVIHRLDRPTTGVVLFARTSKGLERMNAAFKNRETQKNYWALVEGQLSQGGELVHYLLKNSKAQTSSIGQYTFVVSCDKTKYKTVDENLIKLITAIKLTRFEAIGERSTGYYSANLDPAYNLNNLISTLTEIDPTLEIQLVESTINW